jgi:hypothetical protein
MDDGIMKALGMVYILFLGDRTFSVELNINFDELIFTISKNKIFRRC